MRLLIYLPQDHSTAQTEVTDLHGKTVMRVRAVREGSEIRVQVDSEKGSYRVEALSVEGLTVVESNA